MPLAASVLGYGGASSDSAKYVGIDTLQEQSRLKALRSGFKFNLMVAGRSGLGKSTLVNTLFKANVARKESDEEPIPSTTKIRESSGVLSEGGVNLHLTVTDTPGFGDHVNNENCWEPLVSYIEDQYKKYLIEEQAIERLLHIPDTRIHCCLYFISPSGHEMSSLDVEVLKRLNDIVNVVPIIAKSDTLTIEERLGFKERIKTDLLEHEIKSYPNHLFEDPEDEVQNSKLREKIPFAVVGSRVWHDCQGKKILGRRNRWGLVEIENKNHCDFSFLRDMLVRTHMKDMMDTTASQFYEAYRKKELQSLQTLQSNFITDEKSQRQHAGS